MDNNFELKNNRLLIAGKDAELIAQEFGTPIYVCNLSHVKAKYQKVTDAFKKYSLNGTVSRVFYAMKANGHEEILKALLSLDASIELSSVNELKAALEIGYHPSKLIFTGLNLSSEQAKYIASTGVLVNIDSFSELELFKPYAPMDISIRLNPGLSTAFNQTLEMAGKNLGTARLGIHLDRIHNAYQIAKESGLRPVGIHQHVGSNWLGDKLPDFFAAAKVAVNVVKELKESNIILKHINFGGGLGLSNSNQLPYFPLDDYCKGIWDIISHSGISFESVSIEPGRYIVGDSTLLLAKANMVETKANINYIGLDTGFNTWNHKILYNIGPEIINVSRPNQTNLKNYCIAGNLGESGDVFADDIALPETQTGDIIAIGAAGAYCASELANFHMQQLPIQFFLEQTEKFDMFPFCKACPKNCCYIGAVNVLPEEYNEIVKRTGRFDVFKKTGEYFIIDKKKGEGCPFLEIDGVSCSIQDIKPTDCKVWPIYFNEAGSTTENTISPDCPAHKFIPFEIIYKFQKNLAEIPENLRKDFYKDTYTYGYTLKPLNFLENDH